jgi:hypothetical protein
VKGQDRPEARGLSYEFPEAVAVVFGVGAAVIDVNLVDDFHAVDGRLDQLLSELLVIVRIDAAAEHDAFVGLLHFERTQLKNTALAKDFPGPSGNLSVKNLGHPSLPSILGQRAVEPRDAPANSMSFSRSNEPKVRFAAEKSAHPM